MSVAARPLAVVVGLSLSLSPVCTAAAQTPSRAANVDLPVTKVMLFSSGVGYFEHVGLVHGNSATELRFKTTQINDILKSLMLQDQDGGRVGTITYPSQNPLAKTLRSFQVDITQNPSLGDLLNQLRGARVTIQTPGERTAGTILGVEMRRRPVDKSESALMPVLNVMNGATIRSINLDAISSLSLDDPQLQEELTKALSALTQERDQDKKPVTINFAGSGDRHVRIGYVVETPVWKTSYRLMLDDKRKIANVQGWAIVENQTESDWNNVSLSLVSGRPISFAMDLYQPLYATRQTVVPELFAGLRPSVYDGGTMAERQQAPMVAPASAEAPRPPQRRIGYGPDGRPSAVSLNEVVVTSTGRAGSDSAGSAMDIAASVSSAAAAGKLGDLFQYTVNHVTLARQKSAMIPIVTDTVHAERVSIYNAATLASNPLTGVWFTNTTGKHLLQGPVTVLDGGGYAGDARIDNVPPGQSRLLSYGIDLDLAVAAPRASRTSAITTAKIDRGSLVMSRRLRATMHYAIDNKSSKEKTLIIEHPINVGWKLVDTQQPFESTPTHYRFKGAAPANTVTTLEVKEEWATDEVMKMTTMDGAQLMVYAHDMQIPPAVRDAINGALERKRTMSELDQQINARTQRITEITVEQNRIRENMKSVAQSSEYYARLLAKLNEQESSIEKLQIERLDLTTKRDSARRDLESYLGGLTIN